MPHYFRIRRLPGGGGLWDREPAARLCEPQSRVCGHSGRVQSLPVLVIIDEPNDIMGNEVIGAFTGMLNSSSMKNSS